MLTSVKPAVLFPEKPTIQPLAYFLDLFREHQNTPCAVSGSSLWTYGDLAAQINEERKRLQMHGIKPGHVVIVTGQNNWRQICLFFSLALEGATIALFAGSDQELMLCQETATATHVITVSRQGEWSILARDCTVTNQLLLSLGNEPGLIVFTSGSTGDRKAILHRCSTLLRRFVTRRRTYRTLMFSTLDHLGGLNTVLYMLSNAGFIVFPSSQKVNEACALIQEHRVQVLPTTPSFLNLLLLSRSYEAFDLSSLELITYGSEVMPASTLQRLRQAMPAIAVQQTYGLSEMGLIRVKIKDPDSRAVKIVGEGYETRICDGTLWVRSDSAMVGYLNGPTGFTDDGWFDTGDMVEVDGEYLTFLGRKTNIINVAGVKVYPTEVESFILSLPGVSEVVVSGEPNAFVGAIVVAHVVGSGEEPEESFIRRLHAECKKRLPRFMVPSKIFIAGKVEYSPQHKKLREIAG